VAALSEVASCSEIVACDVSPLPPIDISLDESDAGPSSHKAWKLPSAERTLWAVCVDDRASREPAVRSSGSGDEAALASTSTCVTALSAGLFVQVSQMVGRLAIMLSGELATEGLRFIQAFKVAVVWPCPIDEAATAWSCS